MQISHRDLKTANILINYTDKIYTAKIADFGLSKEMINGRHRTGTVVGTPAYLPTIKNVSENFDESNDNWKIFDIYAFGLVMWCVFSNQPNPPTSDTKII